ncbi:MAG: tRNA (N6-isopentenyl adenosine(37)-C2)-methylthiotransferase MiaB [Coriobacteriales bacterium]|jgi:tRNA-2-methylthio-N6-dimethylallyladenosine synthase
MHGTVAHADTRLIGRSFHVKVFGCQMNRNDAELVRGILAASGAIEVPAEESAEIVVFMTCCVREKADTRVFGQISSIASEPAPSGSALPKKIVAVGGCIGQRDGEKLVEMLPGVDVVFGTHNIEDLPGLLDDAMALGAPQARLVDDRAPYAADTPKTRESGFHAWLPIMKGCNNFCTYCIVPYVRGREMSRPLEEIVAEAASLVEDGVREITLLGQNVNSYGYDLYGEARFAQALRSIGETGIERLRFVTSHPKDLSDETIAAMAEVPAVMPALHLPVQSGSDRVLRAMNRGYTAEHYLGIIERLRAAVPGIALSSDVIVGFPGETAEDFEATFELVKSVGYAQVFTFIYSRRAGTPAAKMPDDTPREVIQERFDRLVEVVQQGAWDFNQGSLGATVPVLVEGVSKRDEGIMAGKSPQNQTVHFPCPQDSDPDSLVGSIVDVKVDKARTWYLSGELA